MWAAAISLSTPKTALEPKWACLSYNIIRLFSIRGKIATKF
jgi:hypothetical protein